jgi:hypothetical protein
MKKGSFHSYFVLPKNSAGTLMHMHKHKILNSLPASVTLLEVLVLFHCILLGFGFWAHLPFHFFWVVVHVSCVTWCVRVF